MARKKKEAPIAPPVAAVAPAASPINILESRVAELEGDLSRIVELLVKGDLDSAKFKEILAKRQGPAK